MALFGLILLSLFVFAQKHFADDKLFQEQRQFRVVDHVATIFPNQAAEQWPYFVTKEKKNFVTHNKLCKDEMPHSLATAATLRTKLELDYFNNYISRIFRLSNISLEESDCMYIGLRHAQMPPSYDWGWWWMSYEAFQSYPEFPWEGSTIPSVEIINPTCTCATPKNSSYDFVIRAVSCTEEHQVICQVLNPTDTATTAASTTVETIIGTTVTINTTTTAMTTNTNTTASTSITASTTITATRGTTMIVSVAGTIINTTAETTVKTNRTTVAPITAALQIIRTTAATFSNSVAITTTNPTTTSATSSASTTPALDTTIETATAPSAYAAIGSATTSTTISYEDKTLRVNSRSYRGSSSINLQSQIFGSLVAFGFACLSTLISLGVAFCINKIRRKKKKKRPRQQKWETSKSPKHDRHENNPRYYLNDAYNYYYR